MTLNKTYPFALTLLSLVGLLASFVLMWDTVELAKNPNIDLPCNINPFISCTSVANSKESQIFGFPNPLIGIISFSMLFTTGIGMILGVNFNKKYMLFLNTGLLLSFLFVIWFYYQSVYNIGSLCIYCMVVWAVTWPLFLYSTVWNYINGNINNSRIIRFISENKVQLLLTIYVLGIALILLRFKDFFFS
jgi:uncharacterized membrane protein